MKKYIVILIMFMFGINFAIAQHEIDLSGNDIVITPNGTGNVLLGNFTFDGDDTVGAGQDGYVLTYDHSGTQTIKLQASAGGGGGGAGWSMAVDPTMWTTPFVGPTAGSNNIAPIWVYQRNATNSTLVLAGVSYETVIQDVYRMAKTCPPPGSASLAWVTASALKFRIWSSTNDSSLAKIDLRVVSPSGNIATTNNLTGGNADFVTYTLPASWMPAIEDCDGTEAWNFEITQYLKDGHTNGVDAIYWQTE